MIRLQLEFNILKRCAIIVDNSPFVEYAGNALIAIITIYARLVITETSTIFVTDSIGSAQAMLLGDS
jgi:hypothetical protein